MNLVKLGTWISNTLPKAHLGAFEEKGWLVLFRNRGTVADDSRILTEMGLVIDALRQQGVVVNDAICPPYANGTNPAYVIVAKLKKKKKIDFNLMLWAAWAQAFNPSDDEQRYYMPIQHQIALCELAECPAVPNGLLG